VSGSQHWKIENQLCFPKDKVFSEDSYHLESTQVLLNGSILRTIAINLLHMNGFPSLKSAWRQSAHRVDKLFSHQSETALDFLRKEWKIGIDL
jgi:hypothetical protein